MLESLKGVIYSDEPVAAARDYKLLGELAVDARNELGDHVADWAFGAGHFPDDAVVLASVEDYWMAFLRDDVDVMLVQLTL